MKHFSSVQIYSQHMPSHFIGKHGTWDYTFVIRWQNNVTFCNNVQVAVQTLSGVCIIFIDYICKTKDTCSILLWAEVKKNIHLTTVVVLIFFKYASIFVFKLIIHTHTHTYIYIYIHIYVCVSKIAYRNQCRNAINSNIENTFRCHLNQLK